MKKKRIEDNMQKHNERRILCTTEVFYSAKERGESVCQIRNAEDTQYFEINCVRILNIDLSQIF